MVHHNASFFFQPFERLANISSKEYKCLCLHCIKSSTEAIMRIPQIVTYTVREKGMEYKGEQR